MSRELKQRFSIITWRASIDPDLSDSEYRTLGVIAAYADKDGWCYPSQSLIAEKRERTRQTINDHVKKLRELGYLVVRPNYRPDGGQTSNLMQVRLDFPPSGGEREEGGSQVQSRRGVSGLDLTRGVGSRLDTNIPEEQYQTNTHTDEGEGETTSPRKAKPSPDADKDSDSQANNSGKRQDVFQPVLENMPEEEEIAPTPSSRVMSRSDVTNHLTDLFCRFTGLKVPDALSHAAFNKLWRTPLWEIYNLCEKDLDLSEAAVRDTCAHMRDEQLTISRPRSIINIARDRIAQGKHHSQGGTVEQGNEGGLWL